jgi:hypothetical protein
MVSGLETLLKAVSHQNEAAVIWLLPGAGSARLEVKMEASLQEGCGSKGGKSRLTEMTIRTQAGRTPSMQKMENSSLIKRSYAEDEWD